MPCFRPFPSFPAALRAVCRGIRGSPFSWRSDHALVRSCRGAWQSRSAIPNFLFPDLTPAGLSDTY